MGSSSANLRLSRWLSPGELDPANGLQRMDDGAEDGDCGEIEEVLSSKSSQYNCGQVVAKPCAVSLPYSRLILNAK